MSRRGPILVLLLAAGLLTAGPAPSLGQPNPLVWTPVTGYFDCWRDGQGEWTLVVGGLGSAILGVPNQPVRYFLASELPVHLRDRPLVLHSVRWDSRPPDDPYYGSSIPHGTIESAFVHGNHLYVHLETVLTAREAPLDITHDWQVPPVLGLRYHIPLRAEFYLPGDLPADPPATLRYLPPESAAAPGSLRGWLREPLWVRVLFEGESPVRLYEYQSRLYSWVEDVYERTPGPGGYSEWVHTETLEKQAFFPRAAYFDWKPDRFHLEWPGEERWIRPGNHVLLDTETPGLQLTGRVSSWTEHLRAFSPGHPPREGDFSEMRFTAPRPGTWTPGIADMTRPLAEVTGLSGIYRLDFTPPEVSLSPEPPGSWLREPFSVEYSLSDALSGIHGGSLSWEDVSYLDVSGQQAFGPGDRTGSRTFTGDGVYRVLLEAQDVAGHTAGAEQGLYKLDRTPPAVWDLQIAGDPLEELSEVGGVPCHRIVPGADAEVTFRAGDNLSGLESVYAAFLPPGGVPEPGDWQPVPCSDPPDLTGPSSVPLCFPLPDAAGGFQVLHLLLRDRAGNETRYQTDLLFFGGFFRLRIVQVCDPRWEGVFWDPDSRTPRQRWEGVWPADLVAMPLRREVHEEEMPLGAPGGDPPIHWGYAVDFLVDLYGLEPGDGVRVEAGLREAPGGPALEAYPFVGDQPTAFSAWPGPLPVPAVVPRDDHHVVAFRLWYPFPAVTGPVLSPPGGRPPPEVFREIRDAPRPGALLVALDLEQSRDGVVLATRSRDVFWYRMARGAGEDIHLCW